MAKLPFVFKVWLCVWVLVTLLSIAIRSLGQPLPLFVQTLIVSAILVPLMVYVIIPYLSRGGGNRSPQAKAEEGGL
ncbi:hypothetical protein GM415_02460 [Pseudodesulfovibrio cashew]|uniref:DUF2842 domain-containing protein n=1 Tax=Pseudodesulfovibrio cashew TaxID=2678688 RepID=A0A6I6JMX1_9BACT|nr:hypothetical protein [Pseudodesulfovibrio cashew]QGY39044.1 hypothetical protein GM415_02460 [Pseudodesulfovibrio cashew]